MPCAFAARVDPYRSYTTESTKRGYLYAGASLSLGTSAALKAARQHINAGMLQNNSRYSSGASRAFSAIQSYVLY